jgi:hypothetical protein
MVPKAGLNDHVTAVWAVPATAAVNCWVWDTVRLAVEGLTETLTGGTTVTLALAVLDVSAALVAVAVTVCAAETELGAV